MSLQGAIAAANKLIAADCLAAYREMNIKPNGQRYVIHRSYSVPVQCTDLLAVIQRGDENEIKAAMVAYRIGSFSLILGATTMSLIHTSNNFVDRLVTHNTPDDNRAQIEIKMQISNVLALQGSMTFDNLVWYHTRCVPHYPLNEGHRTIEVQPLTKALAEMLLNGDIQFNGERLIFEIGERK